MAIKTFSLTKCTFTLDLGMSFGRYWFIVSLFLWLEHFYFFFLWLVMLIVVLPPHQLHSIVDLLYVLLCSYDSQVWPLQHQTKKTSGLLLVLMCSSDSWQWGLTHVTPNERDIGLAVGACCRCCCAHLTIRGVTAATPNEGGIRLAVGAAVLIWQSGVTTATPNEGDIGLAVGAAELIW